MNIKHIVSKYDISNRLLIYPLSFIFVGLFTIILRKDSHPILDNLYSRLAVLIPVVLLYFCTIFPKKNKYLFIFGLISLVLLPYILFFGTDIFGWYDEFEAYGLWTSKYAKVFKDWDWLPYYGMVGTPNSLGYDVRLTLFIPNYILKNGGEISRLFFRFFAYFCLFISFDNIFNIQINKFNKKYLFIITFLITLSIFSLEILFGWVFGGLALTIPYLSIFLSYLYKPPENKFHKIFLVFAILTAPFSTLLITMPIIFIASSVPIFFINNHINIKKQYINYRLILFSIIFLLICATNFYDLINLRPNLLNSERSSIGFIGKNQFDYFSYLIPFSLDWIKSLIRLLIPSMKYSGGGLILVTYVLLYVFGSKVTRKWIIFIFLSYILFFYSLTLFLLVTKISYRVDNLSLVFHVNLFPLIATLNKDNKFNKLSSKNFGLTILILGYIFGLACNSLARKWLKTINQFQTTNTSYVTHNNAKFNSEKFIQRDRLGLIGLAAQQNPFWKAGFDITNGVKISWRQNTLTQIKRENTLRKRPNRMYWDFDDIDNKLLNDFSIDYLAFEKTEYNLNNYSQFKCDITLKSFSSSGSKKLNKLINNYPFLIPNNFKGFNSDICLTKINNQYPVLRFYPIQDKNNKMRFEDFVTQSLNQPPDKDFIPQKFTYHKSGIYFENPYYLNKDSLIIISIEKYNNLDLRCRNSSLKFNDIDLEKYKYFGILKIIPSSCKNLTLDFN
tara:strand:- start:579 stop:2765 length:2187 start_codon:yes stop_codon:yes gene_type:complete